MSQQKLFFESLDEAIRDTVTALGGPKSVGHILKPEKAPDAAGRWLNDCLNEARPEVLHFDQFLLLAQMGRREGVHNIMVQLCREAGYADPVPIDPQDEAAQLQKEFITAYGQLETLAKRLERLAPQLKAVS